MSDGTMSARDQILGSIRRSLGRAALTPVEAEPLYGRLGGPPENLIPARAKRDPAGLEELFRAKVVEAACSLDVVDDIAAVPAAVAAWLARENLPARVRQAPALAGSLDWSATAVDTSAGPSDGTDDTSVTPVFAAVAETGTCLLLSGTATPTTLNFLPENHVVVIRADQVVGSLEEAWTRVRALHGGADGVVPPRTMNLITGPSRTGDIEQKIQMGAHGPRRMHVVLVRG